MTEPAEAAAPPDRIYTPAPGEAQLTAKAIIVGSLLGSVVSCTNIYIGLKIGWTFGASIIAAVLGFAIFRAIGASQTVLETNITQTAGSAAGSMASAAGLVAAIPAMQMLGFEIEWWGLMLWALSVAFLGVFFAVPLRRQVVEIDRLRFPTGTATAETIVAMFSDAGEAAKKAKVLIYAGLFAGAFTLTSYWLPEIEMPPLHKWIEVGALSTAAAWGFKLYLGPSLFGAGFLIGPRVSLSLLVGAIGAWAILGPIANDAGWVTGPIMSYKDGVRGWLLWPGVALMVAEALTSLALSWKTFVRALTMTKSAAGAGGDADDPDRIPNSWWIIGLALGTTMAAVVGSLVFGIPAWMTVLAVALSSVLAIVAVRSTGETDINPVGGMGKVTQLVYGGVAPGAMDTNLMAAAVTGAGASQAADMMQDLKTGHMLGAAPRKQFIAQIIGICAGVVFVVPAYYLLTAGTELGSEAMPAPAAFAWKAMAEVLAIGFDALPPHALEAAMVAGAIGVLLPLLSKIESIKKYVPSGLAMGIAFIIPAYYSLVMVYGMIAWFFWKQTNPQAVDKYNFALASGLVAGEGLMGMVKAAMTLLGV